MRPPRIAHRPPGLLVSALIASLAALCAGCVERTLEIRTDPPGAKVYLDGRLRGTTKNGPLLLPFDHYGTRELSVRLEGYRPVTRMVDPATPIYQVFPLDFFFECLFPFTLHDQNLVDVRLLKLPPPGTREQEKLERKLAARAEKARKEWSHERPRPTD